MWRPWLCSTYSKEDASKLRPVQFFWFWWYECLPPFKEIWDLILISVYEFLILIQNKLSWTAYGNRSGNMRHIILSCHSCRSRNPVFLIIFNCCVHAFPLSRESTWAFDSQRSMKMPLTSYPRKRVSRKLQVWIPDSPIGVEDRQVGNDGLNKSYFRVNDRNGELFWTALEFLNFKILFG